MVPQSIQKPIWLIKLYVQSLGSFQYEGVFSLLLLYFFAFHLLYTLHFISIASFGEICGSLCCYFWNNYGIAPFLNFQDHQNCSRYSNVRSHKSYAITHLMWNAMYLMINEALKRQLQRINAFCNHSVARISNEYYMLISAGKDTTNDIHKTFWKSGTDKLEFLHQIGIPNLCALPSY